MRKVGDAVFRRQRAHRGSSPNARMDLGAHGTFVEEGRDACAAVRNVLDDDHGHGLGLCTLYRALDVLQGGLCVPERVCALREVVVLQVDDEQRLGHGDSADLGGRGARLFRASARLVGCCGEQSSCQSRRCR